MRRTIWAAVAVAFLLGGPAAAADQGMAGTWAFKVDDRVLFLVILNPGPGGAPASGAWLRPRQMTVDAAGGSASGVELPAISEPVEATLAGGVLRLVAHNPAKADDTDTFEFRLMGSDEAELQFVGAPLPPLRLIRAGPDARIDPSWGQATVGPTAGPSNNPEMTRIFEADQAARQGNFARIDWKVVSKQDAEHRARVAELIARNELRSGEDFLNASFVFQHGDEPNDYLLAHTLALIATKKGAAGAPWIAAATLDRYLQAIGRPQVYGTQYKTPSSGPVTQEPYDRALVSDALRRLLGVPDQKGQAAQRADFQAQADAALKSK